jgi:hypothetical protein
MRFLFAFEGRTRRPAYLLRFVLAVAPHWHRCRSLVPPLNFNAAMVSLMLVSLWPVSRLEQSAATIAIDQDGFTARSFADVRIVVADV